MKIITKRDVLTDWDVGSSIDNIDKIITLCDKLRIETNQDVKGVIQNTLNYIKNNGTKELNSQNEQNLKDNDELDYFY